MPPTLFFLIFYGTEITATNTLRLYEEPRAYFLCQHPLFEKNLLR